MIEITKLQIQVLSKFKKADMQVLTSFKVGQETNS